MTQTLKKQLTTLCVVSLCGGVLMWNVSALRAQNGYEEKPIDTPPPTMDETARLFGRMLQVNRDQNDVEIWTVRGPEPAESYLKLRLISQRDRQLLGMLPIDVLLEDLKKNQTLVFESSAPRQEGGKTVVDITPKSTSLAPAPVVMVAEAGGYRVDLIATYAKRLKLGEGALQQAIYDRTDVALDGLPGQNDPKEQRTICLSNLKGISYAILQYSQDYDEKLPPAKVWINALKPYEPRQAAFRCPALPKDKKFGFAYNSKLSGKGLYPLFYNHKVVSFYETSILKPNAYGSGENLAFRHQNGANYAFLDGHVKWFPKTATPSFKLKP